MNLIEHLQRLDALIIEHTKPPVTAMLRRELSFAIEQGEAYQAASDKQDQTLATQAETIDRLVIENLDLVSAVSDRDRQIADINARNKKATNDWIKAEAQKHRRLIQSKQLNHKV